MIRGSSRGFTMIEVLVSMTVALIALAAVPVSLRIVSRATLLARNGTAAVAFAQAKLEELVARNGDLPDGNDSVGPPAAPITYARDWHVTAVAPRSEVRRVAVTVRWDNDAHRLTLETFACEP